jgi:hypothetical protein
MILLCVVKGQLLVLNNLLMHLKTNNGFLKCMKMSMASANAIPKSLFSAIFPLFVNFIVDTHFA